MERESFEDEEVARVLNDHFVAIKVDREERPDIDHIYMTVCQAMTGQGGWPLTVILTPDKRAFFAGTYFPKERKYGRIGLLELLHQIHQKWTDDPDKITTASLRIMDHVGQALARTAHGDVRAEWLDDAYQGFVEAFDETFGGFGEAPKFPTPHNLMFLMRYGHVKNERQAIEMVETTLHAMYQGGIYDHVGYGFARYSTDREWLVPHFEKMLYDNALLVIAYLEAHQLTGKAEYAAVVTDVLTYLERTMMHPQGGFYSAEDADSEGVEGKFYVWNPGEVIAILGEDRGARYCRYYGITSRGNFEGENIPNLIQQNISAFCSAEGIDVEQWAKEVRTMNEELYQVREKRIHPHKDDKVLTAWNGLAIGAFAAAGRVLRDERYIEIAKQAHSFLQRHLTADGGRLLARYRDGEAAHLGYVDDYAFLIWADLELYEATFDARYVQHAVQLQEDMLRLFWDSKAGGFYFFGSDGEQLIARPKEVYDGATPSGNSVSALNLQRLAALTGELKYKERAEQLLAAFAQQIEDYPMGHSFMLMAVQYATGRTREIVIVEGANITEGQQMLQSLQASYLPESVLLFVPKDDARPVQITDVNPFLKNQPAQDDKTTVYICENFSCNQPLTEVDEVMAQVRTLS